MNAIPHNDKAGRERGTITGILTSQMKWCSNCLAASTRPRITFDERGWCNACQWAEEKKSLNWNARENELNRILNKYRRNDGGFDCLVPVSGGKDGSYVAYNLKHKYKMNPLCITVSPPLPREIGDINLKNFVNSGYSHISVNMDPKAMQQLNKAGLIEKGFPYFGWLMAIQSVPVRFAKNFNINLIFYGEDGEVEYGGTNITKNQPFYNVEYMKDIYLEGGYEKVLSELNSGIADLELFRFPEVTKDDDIKITHWSFFENWDPYRNYVTAKEKCGLTESEDSNTGTFTNFAQNDQMLYELHTYLMYLKFGFGRANQDACIEIRRGAMEREQAINLVKLYDGTFPSKFLENYCEYYEMTKEELMSAINKWANKDLFDIDASGMPIPKFEIS